MPRLRTRTAVLTRTSVVILAGALALTACGEADDPTVVATETPSASPSPTEPPVCPIEAVMVEPTPGSTADLEVQPVIPASADPAPTEIEVADIVVGNGDVAMTGDMVEVKYVGAFYETGMEFDSSWSRSATETLPFRICAQGVIEGFAVGPTGMAVGGRREITIPSEFAYGPEGQPPAIGPDATLVFVVDLMSVTPTP